MRRCIVIASVVLCGLFAAGCDSDPKAISASDAGTNGSNGLVGRQFLLQSAEGFTPVANTTVRIFFDPTSFGFYAGCNHFSAEYTLSGGRLRLGGLGSTEIGCEQPLADQDNWLADFVSSSPTLDLVGNDLTLTGAQATLHFLDRVVADPDRPLTGRVWTIDTVIESGAAMSGGWARATLQFDDQGNVSVDTGCNTANGQYTTNSNNLVLSGMSYTHRTCLMDAGPTIDAQVHNVMSNGTLTFEITAARLQLLRGTIGLAATTP
ncbi:MAG TPA: META domain-containing protein [Polyangiaceae bacterium]|jgi:heat shock protein HslJ|nr:META domain-containing protein [Polyangiaceae bacterium]